MLETHRLRPPFAVPLTAPRRRRTKLTHPTSTRKPPLATTLRPCTSTTTPRRPDLVHGRPGPLPRRRWATTIRPHSIRSRSSRTIRPRSSSRRDSHPVRLVSRKRSRASLARSAGRCVCVVSRCEGVADEMSGFLAGPFVRERNRLRSWSGHRRRHRQCQCVWARWAHSCAMLISATSTVF